MHVPTAELRGLLDRGVYKAPWMGPNGEIVLLAVTSKHCLVSLSPIVIPAGSNHVQAVDELWDMLDAIDPLTAEEIEALARRRAMQVI